MWHSIGWIVGHFQPKETTMRALWLCVVVLTTACTDDIQLSDTVRYTFDREKIKAAELHCATQSGLRHIELKLGPNPHYLVHCNEGVVAHREIVCESCKDGRPENSYLLTAPMLTQAKTFCRYPNGLVWIEFQLRPSQYFKTICDTNRVEMMRTA